MKSSPEVGLHLPKSRHVSKISLEFTFFFFFHVASVAQVARLSSREERLDCTAALLRREGPNMCVLHIFYGADVCFSPVLCSVTTYSTRELIFM